MQQVGFSLQDCIEMHSQQNIKIRKRYSILQFSVTACTNNTQA